MPAAGPGPEDACIGTMARGEWVMFESLRSPHNALPSRETRARSAVAMRRNASGRCCARCRRREAAGGIVTRTGRDAEPFWPAARSRARQACDRARPPEDTKAAGGPAHACAHFVVGTRQSQAPPRQWLPWEAALYLAWKASRPLAWKASRPLDTAKRERHGNTAPWFNHVISRDRSKETDSACPAGFMVTVENSRGSGKSPTF